MVLYPLIDPDTSQLVLHYERKTVGRMYFADYDHILSVQSTEGNPTL